MPPLPAAHTKIAPFTLSVGSASQHGQFPWYGERCASTLVTAFSSGAYSDQMISTADLHNKCTSKHTGTSASAPLAAGIIALVLEANPRLGWRDVQHLAVCTAEVAPLRANRGWRLNGAGRLYNPRFGFGLLHAARMVRAAKTWQAVPPWRHCYVNASSRIPYSVQSGVESRVLFSTDGCAGQDNSEVNYLEHVQVTVDIQYPDRGALDIFLISPSGTLSMLLSRRFKDHSSEGFKQWPFLSVHFWGEQPKGDWWLIIRDKDGKGRQGSISSAYLTLHGTKERPAYVKPRGYTFIRDVVWFLETSPEYDENDDVNLKSDKPIRRRPVDWSDLVNKKSRSISSVDI